ncbi:AAA family ATPase [Clostridium botulinum]|uniref:AAA family ATPase n=2 Tax=Clostridium botulinum TaxID=1491 RepID=A0A846I699_CLOBO|nr:hypothetical protein [Clostridium botulinum]AJD27030.1 putative membrane protein [Clostridium botulinum CDC_297]EPS48189.1 putative ABC transporter membrane protein [Clostridium botulinum A1 str. CFSAN002368]ACQ52839.1 putative ABC transporter, membrane protein [Clostridium botulinum Ba4 str. 657]AJE11336.1 putative membrane protein [Clostridium botulinum CDC_1436]APR00133.1 putative membrane protein [Clostridium botulinum]
MIFGLKYFNELMPLMLKHLKVTFIISFLALILGLILAIFIAVINELKIKVLYFTAVIIIYWIIISAFGYLQNILERKMNNIY